MMTSRSVEMRPQAYARTAGTIYLLIILLGGFSEGYVANKLIVAGDPVATAQDIFASPGLWRISVAGNLIVPVIATVQLWAEYLLLRPISKNLTLLFALFTIISLSVEAVSKIFLLLAGYFLRAASHAPIFSTQQMFALSYTSLAAHDLTFNMALLFFGCACVVEGYLISISGYFPKMIGVLMQLAGVCYLIASFSALLLPTFSNLISPAILLPPLVGELSLALWLLLKGVNLAAWQVRVSGSQFIHDNA